MMTVSEFQSLVDRTRYAQCWAISLVAHAGIVACSIAFVSALKPAPTPEPFRWEVALVEGSRSAKTVTEEPPPVAPSPAPVASPPKPVRRPAIRSMPPIPRQPTTVAVPAQTEPKEAAAVEPLTKPEPQQAPFPTFEAIPAMPAAPAPQAPHAQPASPTPANYAHRELASLTPSQVGPSPKAQTAPAESATGRPDLSWLPGILLSRLQHLPYPPEARLNGWEGRVVVRLMIHEDGSITDVTVNNSSGHAVLDEAAVRSIRALSPLPLPQALPGPKSVSLPMTYHLD